MGGNQSKPGPDVGRQGTLTTAAPAMTPTPCPSNDGNRELPLVIAFLAGILLALLLMVLVFIIRRYGKCQSSSHALDPHSDPLAKTPAMAEEALPSASMPLKTSEEKRDPLTANHSANSGSIVYAEIKVTSSPYISNMA